MIASVPASARADAHVRLGSLATVSAGEPTLLRTSPGFDAPAAREMAPGGTVTVIDGPVAAADGSLWYLVDAGGYLPGYALSGATTVGIAEPLDQGDSSTPAVVPPPDPAASAPPSNDAGPTGTVGIVSVVGTNGAGATCRSAADSGSVGTGWLPEGSAVDVTGVQAGGWLPVNCNGAPGFVDAAFVTWDGGADSPPADPATGGGSVSADPAAPAPVAERLPAATDPTLAAPAPGTLAEPVPAEPAVEPALEPEPGPVSDRGRRSGGGGGQAIADLALQFDGYPYVYAGADPSTGFDCSGFTMYVIQQTLGLDITHDMFAQYAMGTPVDRSDLRPGDLVFFQNTFRPGMSHNGVYIGDGQMVHAENESTGVKISDINSDYYSSRWYGAVRLG